MSELIAAPPLIVPPWVIGNYYDYADVAGGTPATSSLAADTIYFTPIYVPPIGPRTADRIGVQVSTVGAANSKVRLASVTMGADGKPAALILDAGELDTAASIGLKEATISQLLPVGWSYLAIQTSIAPTIYVLAGSAGYAGGAGNLSQGTRVWVQARTYGAYPATFAVTGTGGTVPRIAVRAA